MSVPTSNEFTQPSFQPIRGRPAWEIACLYPEQGYWEESDYLSIGTNHMIEFDNGFIEVLPMPTILHHLIVDFLLTALKEYVRVHATGLVLSAPLPVRLWPAKYRGRGNADVNRSACHDVSREDLDTLLLHGRT